MKDRTMPDRFEQLARELEQSGNYRVLRRLLPRTEFSPRNGQKAFIGIVLDTETTGLDINADIIELGMIKFEYSSAGEVFRVVDEFNQLQQPHIPIPVDVTCITGITNEMVAGHAIDPGAVNAFVAGADLVIAHNARFDRPLCEKTWPVFATMPWACSVDQIPWRENGFEGAKLGYLLNDYGLFHNGHRASGDCRALLHLLASPFGREEKPALSSLMERARQTTIRLWARDAPYDAKDLLKARGYRWSDGSNSPNKAWWKDLTEDALAAELEFLRAKIYKRASIKLPTERITARERYSTRLSYRDCAP
jgi:DNA polymerase-3 subunit epsilon